MFGMSAQVVAALSVQLFHWIVSLGGGMRVTLAQLPGVSVSVWPTSAVPATEGGEVLIGPAACAPAGSTIAPALVTNATSAAFVKCRNLLRKASSRPLPAARLAHRLNACDVGFRKHARARIIRLVRRLRSNRIGLRPRSDVGGNPPTPVPEPNEGEAIYDLGLLLEEQGDLAGAERAYRRADAAGHAGAACKLGAMFEARSEFTQAEAAFARADERGDASGAFHRGRLLEKAGATDPAEAAYRRADERGHPAAGGNLGILLERRGQRAEARAAYEHADRRGDANSALNLGILLEDLGDRAGARAAYRRARRRGVPRAALPESRSRRRRLALAATLAIAALAALGAGIAGLYSAHTRGKGPQVAARSPNPAPSVAATATTPTIPSRTPPQRKRVTAHRATRHAVRPLSTARSRAPSSAVVGTTVSAPAPLAPPHVPPPPTAGSGGGPSQSSGGGPAVTGGGSVGTGGVSLAQRGGGGTTSQSSGGVRHTTPATASNQPSGTGTVSGGDG